MGREEVHVLSPEIAIDPIDINGAGADSDIFSLSEYDQAVFLLQIGNLAGNTTLTVEECDNFTPSNSTAIAFSYRKRSAAGVLGTKTAVASTGLSILAASDDNALFVIEINARDLTDGYPAVRIRLSDPSAAGVVAATVVMTRARYMEDAMRSAAV